MKNSKGVVYKRQQHILQHLRNYQSARIDELSELLDVSPITIRRDLEIFEKKGIVTRFHGGASLNSARAMEDSEVQDETRTLLLPQKQAIARYAASLVETGDTIFINSSSTCLMMLQYLVNKRVIVITNNGKALLAQRSPMVELVLTGGEVHERKDSLVGDIAMQAISRIIANKTFIGVSGISASSGITTSVLQETAINELMMKRCDGNCYVLADHTKIGRQHNFFSGPIHMVSTVITDSDADADEIARLENKKIKVIKVPAADIQ
ncbi:MAG: DeoR/GlpR family DNA-binding transcription regulator [Saccharofermentanales bacterium]